jgi:ubiquinol-cytochrome c reductase cytochrome c1 subunit
MRRICSILLMALLPIAGFASSGSNVALMSANVNLEDSASLQRGARLFVNYCLSCHGAKYMRYNRMAEDLGLSDQQLHDNLMFASEKSGDTMTVAMQPAQAQKWFGKAPPDLSVITRSRGPDWVYTFLLSFYQDSNPERLFGVNNVVFEATAMPAVLASLQGVQVLVEEEVTDGHGGHETHKTLQLKEPGSMNPAEYKRAVRDLVSFLTYVGEPAKLVRYEIGTWVLLFLVVLFFITYSLKKEYWRDVH